MSAPRNAPCPCGSGKKHKRCCALAPRAAGIVRPVMVDGDCPGCGEPVSARVGVGGACVEPLHVDETGRSTKRPHVHVECKHCGEPLILFLPRKRAKS